MVRIIALPVYRTVPVVRYQGPYWRDWGADPNKEKGAKKKTSGRTDKEKAALGIAFYLLKGYYATPT